MRRNFRLNDSYLSLHLSNKTKYKTQLLQNPFFLEFTQELETQDMEILLSLTKIELFPAKKHIVINPAKLYFTFDESALMTSNIGYEVQGPSGNLVEDFERKYEEIIDDPDRMFRKRMDVLYHRFQLLIRSQDFYLYNASRFFGITSQKSYDIILSQIDSVVAVIDRNKLPPSILTLLSTRYQSRIAFLRSFPQLKRLPQFYFFLYLPSFIYRKYFPSSKIPIPTKEHVYFLQTGEMEFSQKIQGEEVKVYKIIGQQMFVIIEDIDMIKMNGEFVQFYAVLRRNLDGLMAESDSEKEYREELRRMKECNVGLREKAMRFHESRVGAGVDGGYEVGKEEAGISPLIQRSFWNQNIFTKQFNKHIAQLDVKKTGVLKKLLEKSNANSYLYEYKPSVRTMPDMKEILSKVKELKETEYSRIKERRKTNDLISTYKSLVKAGLEQELKPPRNPNPRRHPTKLGNKSLPSLRLSNDNPAKTSSVFDLLRACR